VGTASRRCVAAVLYSRRLPHARLRRMRSDSPPPFRPSSIRAAHQRTVPRPFSKLALSDGRKFSGALPLGTIGTIVGRIEDFVRQAAERVEQSEAMLAR
jgi:hypothetical protein